MATLQEDHESIARRVGAANLLAIRASTGLSQAQFAAAIGLSDRALRRYERGERELPQAARLAIIQVFKIDPLASDQLAAAIGLGDADLYPGATAETAVEEDFWLKLRREGLEFRERNYSPLGQRLLKVRDYAFFQRSSILRRQASRAGVRPTFRARYQWHRLDVPRIFLRDRALLVFDRCRAARTQGRQTYSNGQ